ncbi:type III secretion exporter [Methylocella silvestris BL2]|uniref:Type III secretion exporter n=1 Tax=Methylocella silvestris (strain DSM 15510 / CIP 108128 / LMG 27833 / NCIMB 13906 / BL2) TaxID=395965 RepID=B8EL10_METSB|nr:EscU/YscU/HrcU family type III secretion system export apparatus switch protein [Methylocella silvestris]ACK49005.1 type III secretion exporter [Methylocella silvestris BL2]
MADESTESRTEEATEKKIGDELERGNAPFSREAALFASVSAMLIIGAFFAQQCIASMTLLLHHLLDDAGGVRLRNGNDAVALMKLVSWDVFKVLIAPFVVFAAGGVLASALQNAPRLVVDRILPNFKRISLTEGWQRLHGARGYAEFSKSVVKLASISVIVLAVLQSQQNKLVNAVALEPEALPELILSVAMKLMSVVCIVTAALLAIDLVWSRFHWRRDMRMSRQEIKDEMKQSDGDPVRKARLRSLAQDRVRKNMIAAVPKATLVIANPTHYAIALRYVKEEGGAPMVISKGQDLIALKIRELAERHSIPIIEDKLLARSMYDSVEVDHPIPPQFYKAVAELIHYLYSKSAAKLASK